MMRAIAAMLLAAAAPVLAAAAPVPASAQPASIGGRWATADGNAIVEIYRCGRWQCGKIARVLNFRPGQETRDVHNPLSGLRNRPLLGMNVLTALVASGEYWQGKFYDHRTGRTYDAYLRIEGGALGVKRCTGPQQCQTEIWRRGN